MQKILSIHFPALHNGQHYKLHADTVEMLSKHDPKQLKVHDLFEPYALCVQKEDEAFKKVMKSDLTKSLNELDCKRDDVYTGFTGFIRQTLRHFDPKVAASGERLQILVKTYGDPRRRPYDEETSYILNLLQDLKGKYSADVAMIGAKDWVAELENANRDFDKLLKERRGEYNERNTLAMRECRLDTDAAYYPIAERINALVVVNGLAGYEAFIRELNGLITEYNNILAQRKGRSAAAKTNESKTNGE
jgi:hypothetical protein